MTPEQLIWSNYFLTVAGWQFHPGNSSHITKLTLLESAEYADTMLAITMERFPCLSHQPPF